MLTVHLTYEIEKTRLSKEGLNFTSYEFNEEFTKIIHTYLEDSMHVHKCVMWYAAVGYAFNIPRETISKWITVVVAGYADTSELGFQSTLCLLANHNHIRLAFSIITQVGSLEACH
jgi:hypothetical protein